jgi:tRNA A-37 threonylcarbamoyl transferase component Bud32
MPNQDQSQSSSEKTRVAAPGNSLAGQLQLGSILGGSYRVDSILGRGGMGVVYLAEHLLIKRSYALKVLAPDQVNEANWNRFQSEGKAIAKLEHHNIVKIYDMGVDHGQCPYYVMDLLEGPSLADFIKTNGPLTVDQAVEIFTQICDGLGYAHQCGIIHRDVKPSNIILTGLMDSPRSPVVVKIVDFGLAKLVGAMAQAGQSQTATGEVFGSPYYMSPEQCLGGKIDERSDIYSLGCTLFECLTGRPPFRGASALQTVLMHQNEKPPSLADACPDREFSPVSEQLVALMLKKRPAERPQSMAYVAHDLARIKEGKSVKPRAIFADAPLYEIEEGEEEVLRKPNKIFIGVALTLCTLVIAAGVLAIVRNQTTQKQTQASAARLEVPVEESSEVRNVRTVFNTCAKISDGVVQGEDGQPARIFKFPNISVGEISVGNPPVLRREAVGTIALLPDQKVTLTLMQYSSGKYALMFPVILSQIGPHDIDRLVLKYDVAQGREQLEPQFFEAISGWTDLRFLEIYNFKLSKAAVLGLNNFKLIGTLILGDSFVEGKDLAQVTWLSNVDTLDVKGMTDVDPVLKALSGSKTLRSFRLDETNPSMEGLECLTHCRSLNFISLSNCDIDDKKLAVICKISSLTHLCLSDAKVTGQSLQQLLKLKRLTYVGLKHVEVAPAAIEELRRQMPGRTIQWP